MAETAAPNFDIEEQRVRIWRAIEEAQKFSTEQKKLMAEAAKLERDRTISVWQIVVGALAAAAAFFGAGAAFVKLLGP